MKLQILVICGKYIDTLMLNKFFTSKIVVKKNLQKSSVQWRHTPDQSQHERAFTQKSLSDVLAARLHYHTTGTSVKHEITKMSNPGNYYRRLLPVIEHHQRVEIAITINIHDYHYSMRFLDYYYVWLTSDFVAGNTSMENIWPSTLRYKCGNDNSARALYEIFNTFAK